MKKWFNKMWGYISWFFGELLATCSDEPSYFSKKRIQAWILFDSAMICMLVWFSRNVEEMEIMQIIEFAGVLFVAAGYQISTIQREKRDDKKLKINKDESRDTETG